MVRLLIVVAAATWFICLAFVSGSARVLPLTKSYSNVTFYVDSKDPYTYRLFIQQLRDLLAEDGSVSHSIPVLPTNVPATSDRRFVLVILEEVGNYTNLALDVISANIVGFSAERYSYFFKDVPDDIYASPLFLGTHKTRLPFGGSYGSLEDEGAYRESTTLGSGPFNDAATQLYAYHWDNTIDIAPSLLVAIQMISEAARFTYIEQELFDIYVAGLVPKCDILSLQDNWSTLSNAIQTSVDGDFPPVQLQDDACNTFNVTNVEELAPMMGILLGMTTPDNKQSMDWPSKGDRLIKMLSSVF
ncbi:ribosome-inactivating protein gelonin-like [Ricinus communis]|uniref:rRNA N-glycosylase n=1 Tax=Ricinus communis TaxID=3988 RepID=B9RKZ9_RICCO|nr:ribosome-inactivating protein gelonin [Ricinus communis]XP_048231207.1 ribosome-inactivating protein gelonin-like [Ricinus communis]EEF47914.1 ricin-agglutinin family protein [Ricinus communis]|eukprot:XP_002514418.1 ribosome-inactivating protein gelonin [Ricinus communis]